MDRPAIRLRKETVYRNPSSKERPELPQGNLQRLFNRTATQFGLLAGVAFPFYQCDYEHSQANQHNESTEADGAVVVAGEASQEYGVGRIVRNCRRANRELVVNILSCVVCLTAGRQLAAGVLLFVCLVVIHNDRFVARRVGPVRVRGRSADHSRDDHFAFHQ